jgi:hypothetical protein
LAGYIKAENKEGLATRLDRIEGQYCTSVRYGADDEQ